MNVETIVAIIASLGGLELIRWVWSTWRYRHQDKKKTDAEATNAEFGALKEQIQMLEEFNRDKEGRFQEQTEKVMQLTDSVLTMKLEMNELQMKYNELQRQNNELQSRYNELQRQNNELQAQNNELQERYNALVDQGKKK